MGTKMSNDDEGIYTVETVPPPAGESDLYNAPTRVGLMASSIVEEQIKQARREADTAEAALNAATATRKARPFELEKVVATLREKSDDAEADPGPVDHDADLPSVEALTAQLNEELHSSNPIPLPRLASSTPPEPNIAAHVLEAVPPPAPLAPPRQAVRRQNLLLLALVIALAAFGVFQLRHR
jgi:hypothetical protein